MGVGGSVFQLLSLRGLILKYVLHGLSESPWDGIETQFTHSGDPFIDIHFIYHSSLPCSTSSGPCCAFRDYLPINYLFLNSCLQVCFGGIQTEAGKSGKEPSWNSEHPLCCPTLHPQYKHPCMAGEMSKEGARLSGGLGCQWAHVHSGHVDILSVFLKMSRSVQLGRGLAGPSVL